MTRPFALRSLRSSSLDLLCSLLLFSSTLLAQSPKATQDAGHSPASPKALLALLASPMDAPAQQILHRKIIRFFGHESLVNNRAAAKVEGTTVAWATLAKQPASIVREDGKLLGDMIQIGADGLQVFALDLPNFTETNYRILVDGRIQQGGQVRIEHFEPAPESLPHPDIPKGSLPDLLFKRIFMSININNFRFL